MQEKEETTAKLIEEAKAELQGRAPRSIVRLMESEAQIMPTRAQHACPVQRFALSFHEQL